MTTDQEAEGGSPLKPVPMQPVPPPGRRTRAGRNLPAAIGVGLSLGVVIIGTLYLWKPSFVLVVVVAAVLGAGSEKAAAHRLGLSHSTVKHHLANARSKVGATTTAQLVWILASRLPEPEGARQTDG